MKLTLIAEGLVVILVQTQVNVLLFYKSMLLKFRNLYSVLTISIGLDICFLVAGGWGKWSPWSKCKAKCPKTSGKQMRQRKCNNPPPSNGGANCIGKMKEEKSCKVKCSGIISSFLH